jgi:hypothetical protein
MGGVALEGLGNLFQVYGPVLWLVLTALVLFSLALFFSLHFRVSRMMQHYQLLTTNVDGDNLDRLLENHLAHLYQTSLKVDDLAAYCEEIDQSVRRAIQSVGLVRFNPFNDTGGDQSFVIALLDSTGSGLVLSSLYSRTGNRVFAKSLEGGQSKYPLTDEEQEAIAQATFAPSRK